MHKSWLPGVRDGDTASGEVRLRKVYIAHAGASTLPASCTMSELESMADDASYGPQLTGQEQKRFQRQRFDKWRGKYKAKGAEIYEGKKTDTRWFGRVAKGPTAFGDTVPWEDNDYNLISEDVVIDSIQRAREDFGLDYLGLVPLARGLAEMIRDKLHGDRATRKQLQRALPLTMRSTLRRDRLLLGAVVPGTAYGGTTLQRLPSYSRSSRPLAFLRGVLQLRKRLDGQARKELNDADKLLRRMGVVQIMPEARLKRFDSKKDRVLKGKRPVLDDLRKWCRIGEWIAQNMLLLGKETDSIMEHKELLKRTEWFVFMPTLFEARVRAGLREMLNRDHPNEYVVKKDYRRMNSFPTRGASPDVVVYRKGEEDRTPIAIYDCKLYRKVQADLLHHMHQVEAQRAAFGNPGLVGLIYGLFTDDPDLPKRKDDNVHYIDLRGTKDEATESFDKTLELLRDAVLAAEARDVATQPGPATI